MSQQNPYIQPNQQPVYGAAPQQPPAKKPFFKRVSTWIGIVVVIAVLSALGNNSNSTKGENANAPEDTASTQATQPAGTTTAAEPATTAPPALPGLNTPVTSGQFEATVTGVQTGVKEVGPSGFTKKANDQYVVVSVQVKNTGDRAQYVSSSDIKLVSNSQEFSADTSAGFYMGDEAFVFEQLNPGSTIKGKIAFDVPTDFTVDVLKFSGGLFDTEALVNLKG